MELSDMNSTVQKHWLNLLDNLNRCLLHTKHWHQPTLHGLRIRILTDVGYVTCSLICEHSGYTWREYLEALLRSRVQQVEIDALI